MDCDPGEAAMSDSRACTQCGVTYELTPQFWHKSRDGFHTKCRACRNKEEKRGRQKLRNKKLTEIERGAVDLFLAASRVGGQTIPHSSELLEVLMRYFGGVEGFGNAFMKQYYESPVGGAFRTKQLETVVRLIVGNTAMGGSKKPLELMTEEELEAQYRRDVLAAAIQMRNSMEKDRHAVPRLPELPLVSEDAAGSGGVPEVSADAGPAAPGGQSAVLSVPHDV